MGAVNQPSLAKQMSHALDRRIKTSSALYQLGVESFYTSLFRNRILAFNGACTVYIIFTEH